jgi:hypothetical protein
MYHIILLVKYRYGSSYSAVIFLGVFGALFFRLIGDPFL